MKKMMMTLAAVLCCAMTTTVFTACGSDDDNDKNNPANDDATIVGAQMDCTLTIKDQMFNTLNLFVEYYDADGKVQTEQLKEKEWTKIVKAKLPANLGLRMKGQLKDGIDPNSIEKFTAAFSYTYNICCVTASGKQVGDGKVKTINRSTDMKGAKIPSYLETTSDGIEKLLFTIDSNGKIIASSWQ